MQATDFTLYGWRISWYSAKVRSYMQYKGIPYTEKKPSLLTFKHTIPRHCGGDAVVPAVVSPEGEWLQDSTLIIEQLEKYFSNESIVPSTPIQHFFSLLIEIWADEYWHPTAEHYRFSFPENFPVWRDELSTLLPGAPRVLKRAVVNHFHKFMLDATKKLGVEENTFSLIERWTETQLDALDQHFATMPFLLGSRASLADFALMGPINGHLAWDPRSLRVLITPRQHLHAWIQRMSRQPTQPGKFLPDDEVPPSLQSVMVSLFKELLPYLKQCAALLGTLPTLSARDPRIQRMGPIVNIPFGDGTLNRVVIPYTLWMLQRLQDHFRQLPAAEAETVRQWLRSNGGEDMLSLEFPRLRRVGLHVALEIKQ